MTIVKEDDKCADDMIAWRTANNGKWRGRLVDENINTPAECITEMNGAQINYLVGRFLSWQLPKDFNPDGGISYTPGHPHHMGLTGTNLLNRVQAEAMVRHMVEWLDVSVTQVDYADCSKAEHADPLKHIDELIGKAADALTPSDAMSYSYAALNIANALTIIANIK